MTKDEALKLALEALEEAADAIDSWGSYASGYFQVKHDLENDISKAKSAITAIKEALANEALKKKAENARQLGLDYYIQCCTDQTCPKCKATTPPQRPSRSDIKPLTDEEIILIVADCASSHQHTDIHFARAIERAHGIKGEA